MVSCATVVRIAGPAPDPESTPPSPPDAASTYEVELPRDIGAGRQARAHLDRCLGGKVPGRMLANAKLLATELVNNAVIHGEGRIALRVELGADTVRVEVIDEGTGNAPAIREEARGDADGGRGLRIVDALATRWGSFDGTTHVWADLARAPDG